MTGKPSENAFSIAICTYRRPLGLRRLLDSIAGSARWPDHWRLIEILVVDNDPAGSAQTVVDYDIGHPIRYVHEATPGVTNARNRVLAEAAGDVVVLVDDDEIVTEDWPHALLEWMDQSGAAMVGGPVIADFQEPPPAWVIEGRFFEKTPHQTGMETNWLPTNNLAMRLAPVRNLGLTYSADFNTTGGEDYDFSRSAWLKGLKLQQCAGGSVHEIVGPDRTTVDWLAIRERQSTSNQFASRAKVDGRVRVLLQSLPGASFRLGQAIGLALLGTIQRDKTKRVRAKLTFYRIWGMLSGLTGSRPENYGTASGGDEWTP